MAFALSNAFAAFRVQTFKANMSQQWRKSIRIECFIVATSPLLQTVNLTCFLSHKIETDLEGFLNNIEIFQIEFLVFPSHAI